jgi:outer membrane protein
MNRFNLNFIHTYTPYLIASSIMLVLALFIHPLKLRADNIEDIQLSQLNDTLKIYLHDAVLLGLRNHPTMTMQILEPQIAETYVSEQGAAFEPQLSAEISNGKNKTQRRLGTQPEPVDLLDEQKNYSVELTEFLPTGTEFTLSVSKGGSTSSLYTDQYTGNASLTITQALLQGLGLGSSLAALRKAKLDVDISDAELKGIAEVFIAQIEQSYWDLYLAEKEMSIQSQSLDLAKQQLYESKERVNVGKLAELEVTVVEAEVASRKGDLIAAQSSYEQARLKFLYLINNSQTPNWNVYPLLMDEPFLPDDKLDIIESHEKVALKYRSDLIQSRLSLSKGDLDVRNTRNGLLPKLDLFISLGRTTYAESFQDANPDLESPYYQNNIGVLFNLPLTDQEARAQYKRAILSHEQQKLAVENMEKLVQLDVRSSYIKVQSTRQLIEATSQARILEEKKLDAELEKFRVGKSTNFSVLQAQRDYTASQLDDERANIAYLEALVDLYVAEGSILERRQVEISGQ